MVMLLILVLAVLALPGSILFAQVAGRHIHSHSA
jgi:hypothetical protein